LTARISLHGRLPREVMRTMRERTMARVVRMDLVWAGLVRTGSIRAAVVG
jgi:hypothetical protein